MNRPLPALILAALFALPLAAAAQTQAPPPAPSGSDDMGPPPAVRAKMEAMRAQAKTDAYAALSPDHRTRVQAIVAQVVAGSLDPRAATQQIDALLTPDEQRAIGSVEQKQREQMRVAYAGPDGAPAAPPPSGPPPTYVVPGSSVVPPSGPPPGGPPPEGGRRRRQSAGGFLLRVSLTPDQMRAMMPPRPPAAN
jgi:Spy/CpxP family protein refolding chaperone